tara:strand:+ start:366 stop:1238 length:873 start_codon:yes stop_codon:yes gene_type:complete
MYNCYQNNLYSEIESVEISNYSKELKSNGFLILRKYLKNNHLKVICSELNKIYSFLKDDSFNGLESSLPVGEQYDCLKNDLNINHLPIYSKTFLSLALGGQHLNILRNILNDFHYNLIPNDLPNFILAQMNARVGFNSLPWHNDVRFQSPGEKTFSVQGFLTLDQLNENNGTLFIMPRTHIEGTYPNKNQIQEAKVVKLELEPGDFVLFDSRLHHCTSRNKTTKKVWTILFTYRSWWVKPQFDFWRYFEANKSCIAHLNSLERLMLGECSYSPYDPRESTSIRRSLNKSF